MRSRGHPWNYQVKTGFTGKSCLRATPGRSLQEVQLDKHVKLIDSPGIVIATGSGDSASLVLRNCVKVSVQLECPLIRVVFIRGSDCTPTGGDSGGRGASRGGHFKEVQPSPPPAALLHPSVH